MWVGGIREPLFMFYVNLSRNAALVSFILSAFDDTSFLGNPSRQHSNVRYHKGVRGRGKTGKHGKGEVKGKGCVLAHPPLFPTRKREAVTHGGIRGIDYPTRRRILGSGIIKSWEDKRDRGRIPDTFT